MAVRQEDDVVREAQEILLQTAGLCFFCAEDLRESPKSTGTLLVWKGANATIALHPACAEQLAQTLIADSRSMVRQPDGAGELDGSE